MNRPASLALLFSTAALLAACGGGSGGGASPSPSPTPSPVPAPPPTQTDLNDAKGTKLSGVYDNDAGTLALSWVDTFPQLSTYIVQSQGSGGTYTTIDTIPGQGGQSGPMTWTHPFGGWSVVRVVADDQGRLTPIDTVSMAQTIKVGLPSPLPSIVIDQAEPVTGSVDVSLNDRTLYANGVVWYDDGAQFATTAIRGAAAAWTSPSGTGTTVLRVDIGTANDYLARFRRRVSMSNDAVRMGSSVWSSNGTTYVDISATSSQSGITQVSATLDAGSQDTLYAPNSCGMAPCTPGQAPTLYEFTYDEAANPGSHTLHVASSDASGDSQDMNLLFAINPITYTPADGSIVFGTLPLQGSAIGSGQFSVDAFLDENTQVLADATTPFSIDYDLSGVTPGEHELTVAVHDYDLDQAPESHFVVVASSASLVYSPITPLPPGAQILGADGDVLLFLAADGKHLRDTQAGTDALLVGSATLANAKSWQVSGAHAYAEGTAEDCAGNCIYSWGTDGTRVDLSASDPVQAPQKSGPVARDGTVMWLDVDPGTTPPTSSFTLYDVATASYSSISDSSFDLFAGHYDLGLDNGVLHVEFANGIPVNWGVVLEDWSQATHSFSNLAYPNELDGGPLFDGARIAWIDFDSVNYETIDGSQGGGLDVTSTFQARDGVIAALTSEGVQGVDPGGAISQLSKTSSPSPILYGTEGGSVAYLDNGKLYTWNAGTHATTLRLDTTPNQAFITRTALFFTLGSSNVLYRVPMP